VNDKTDTIGDAEPQEQCSRGETDAEDTRGQKPAPVFGTCITKLLQVRDEMVFKCHLKNQFVYSSNGAYIPGNYLPLLLGVFDPLKLFGHRPTPVPTEFLHP